MPATRVKAAADNASAAIAIAQLYKLRTRQVKESGADVLDAKGVQKQELTLRKLFQRVGFQTADIAGALPLADSTLRGIVSGRTQPALPLPLMDRLLRLLAVEWGGFVAAYEQTLVERAAKAAEKQAVSV